MTLDTMQEVTAALQADGIPATLEYPGFILIAGWTSERDAAIGTANGYWAADLTTRDGSPVLDGPDLPLNLPLTTPSADVARAIMTLWRARFEVFIIAAHGREIIAETETIADATAEAARLLALDGTIGVLINRRR